MKERFERDRENPAHLRDAHITWNQLEPQLQQRRQFQFAGMLSAAEGEFDAHLQSNTEHLMPHYGSVNSYGGRLRTFVQDCRKALDSRERVVIVTAQARRMAEVLGDESILPDAAIHVSPGTNINTVPDPGTL